jgi:hydrogenase-4 membrane subunit HyfE
MSIKNIAIMIVHAFLVWVLCTAAMGVGRAVTTEQNAFIIHATAAPIISALVSLNYFKKFHFTSPLQTAFIFILVPAVLDFLIVALLVLQNMDMFISSGSLFGTWLPLTLIFLAAYLTGLAVTGKGIEEKPITK